MQLNYEFFWLRQIEFEFFWMEEMKFLFRVQEGWAPHKKDGFLNKKNYNFFYERNLISIDLLNSLNNS